MFSDRRIRTSLIAIAADITLTGLKAALAVITGSAALLADALHSGTDLFVSLVLLGSLVIRFRQERQEQASGIEKARRTESILALVVAAIILYVPIEILRGLKQHSASEISNLWMGIGGTLFVIIVVYLISRLKTHVGRETDSPALEADGYHSKIDVLSSVAVLVSLIGMMVGIYLDEVVAVVIAALIAIAGVELFVSGIQSLIRGGDLGQVSMLDTVGHWLIKRTPVRSTAEKFSHLRMKRMIQLLLSIALAGWLLTGVSQIDHGHTGYKERFGAHVATDLQPGLHYHLPWPVERIVEVPAAIVHAVTVGSNAYTGEADAGRLWREINASRVHEDDTTYLTTGDENLVYIEFTLQYRTKEAARWTRELEDAGLTVERFLETALWQQTARNSFEDIIATGHDAFANAVAEQVMRDLSRVGVDIELVGAQLQTIQPPALVVAVYRDQLNAAQEKEQRRQRAQAQRSHDLLLASAERIAQKATIEADANEKKLRAEGESARFTALADVFEKHPEAARFNQYVQTLQNNLAERRLMITDPGIDTRDARVWGQAALITPLELRGRP